MNQGTVHNLRWEHGVIPRCWTEGRGSLFDFFFFSHADFILLRTVTRSSWTPNVQLKDGI